MQKTYYPLIVIALVMMLAACAGNETRVGNKVTPQTVTFPEYREFLAQLDEAVDENIPREFSEREKERFERIHGHLDRLVAQHDSLDTMGSDQRIQLFNLHEQLEGVIVGREEDQMICRRKKTVGTNFRTTECKPRSQWRAEQEAAHRFLQDQFRSNYEGPRN